MPEKGRASQLRALGIELEGKLLERLELLHEELLLVRAHELGALLVERTVERGQEDFRLIEHEEVEEDGDLSEVILRPPATEASPEKTNFAVCFRV